MVADNVVFQIVDFQPDGERDSVGSPSFISHTVGSGNFTLYRDGHADRWDLEPARPRSAHAVPGCRGKPVPFKPGKTWVALVPPVARPAS